MKKIELEIVALSHSVTQSHNYAVVLGETDGNRRLPIVIGGFEAQAIAVALENMSPNRPLTHDLFKNTFDKVGVEVKEIIVSNLLDGIFYSLLICEHNGERVEIDSRTSDAIALAVRYECPIYTYEFIMESAGVILEEGENEVKSKSKVTKAQKPKSVDQLSISELNKKLDQVLENEDYEQAAKIRDEINNRTNQGN